jgi:hypothetical protein
MIALSFLPSLSTSKLTGRSRHALPDPNRAAQAANCTTALEYLPKSAWRLAPGRDRTRTRMIAFMAVRPLSAACMA